MYGSSGHDVKPQGGVLRNYWKCFELGVDNNKCGLLQQTSHPPLLRGCAAEIGWCQY